MDILTLGKIKKVDGRVDDIVDNVNNSIAEGTIATDLAITAIQAQVALDILDKADTTYVDSEVGKVMFKQVAEPSGANAFIGSLWYNTTDKVLNIHDGTEYLPVYEPVIPFGEAVFMTPGTYSWTPPAGITSVSVVLIGGSGGSAAGNSGQAAGGGALAWKNGIPISSTQTYTIVVGDGGLSRNCNWGCAGSNQGTDGTDSTAFGVIAGHGERGGPNQTSNENGRGGYGGVPLNHDGGGDGGDGGTDNSNQGGPGGGGAGGYSGNGGNGAGHGVSPQAGSGGAGGGGACGASNEKAGGGGGGVGLYGQGTSGAAGGNNNSNSPTGGGGGSGGDTGETGNLSNCGNYGRAGRGGEVGGAPGGPNAGTSCTPHGSDGGVRIIWGVGANGKDDASFPYDANA